MTVPEVKEMKPEIRWYKGKYKVKIMMKSRTNYGIKALEFIPSMGMSEDEWDNYVCMFTTVPRLLWRHPRK